MTVSAPRVDVVTAGSPADRAGLRAGDSILRVDGRVPRDVIEWRLWTDEADPTLEIDRGGIELELVVAKRAGDLVGAEVSSAVFDRVRTCDNHCSFCFIHQLPKGMRRSLYLKDDDYRLSFLYGNFTTLTRFTEADLERVVTEGLSPLHVSIHTTDRDAAGPDAAQPARRHQPALAAGAARSRHRGARPGRGVSGRQRRSRLDDTLAGVLDEYPELTTAGRRPARHLAVQHRARPAPAHHGRGGRRRRRGRGLAGRLRVDARSPPRPRRRRVLPAGRPSVPRRRALRGVRRCTRTASAWPARSSSSSPAHGRRPPGRSAGSSPPSTAGCSAPPPLPPNPAAYTGLRSSVAAAPVRLSADPAGAGRDPDRRARRPRAGSARRRRSIGRTCASSPCATSSSAATPASPDCSPAPT